MSIQTRLKKQRYGPMTIIVPTKADLLDDGIMIEHIRRPDPDLMDLVMQQFYNPPIRDRHFTTYIYTVNKYHDSIVTAAKVIRDKSMAVLLNRHLVGKLIYYYLHPNQCGGIFEQYAYAWIHNALCAMRQATLKQQYKHGLIGSWNSVKPWTNGHEPFVKPMGNRAMLALAERLHDVLVPRMEYIAKRSKITLYT